MAVSGSELTPRQETTALLVAEDEITDVEITAKVGISERTLNRWKRLPAVAARIAEHRQRFRDRVLEEGFADRIERVRLLNRMARDLDGQLVAGGYERLEIAVGKGEPVQYRVFDQGRVSAVRGILDDIAKELGERKQVSEVRGTLTLAQLVAQHATEGDL